MESSGTSRSSPASSSHATTTSKCRLHTRHRAGRGTQTCVVSRKGRRPVLPRHAATTSPCARARALACCLGSPSWRRCAPARSCAGPGAPAGGGVCVCVLGVGRRAAGGCCGQLGRLQCCCRSTAGARNGARGNHRPVQLHTHRRARALMPLPCAWGRCCCRSGSARRRWSRPPGPWRGTTPAPETGGEVGGAKG
jgi:hypothetical protein